MTARRDFFSRRAHLELLTGRWVLCRESEEVCEQINRTLFYVLSLGRTRRAGCIEITESITSSIWDRGDLYMKHAGGDRSEGPVSKESSLPQAAWCPLRLYLRTPDWVRFRSCAGCDAASAAAAGWDVMKDGAPGLRAAAGAPPGILVISDRLTS